MTWRLALLVLGCSCSFPRKAMLVIPHGWDPIKARISQVMK